MNKFKFAFIMMLSLFALYGAQNFFGTTSGQDFHYFPEDNEIPNDFWHEDNLTLRKAYYPCTDPENSVTCPNRFDFRNGMIVFPSNFLGNAFTGYVEGSQFQYNTDDTDILNSNYVVDVQTYSNQFIRHSYEALPNTNLPLGLVINFKDALDFTMQDEVIVYMWIFNPNSADQTRFVYACEYQLTNYCKAITDFWVDIDNVVHPARTLRREKISFLRNPAEGNVVVTFNDKTATSHTLPYVNTGDNLYLNYAFVTEEKMRLNLMLVYNSPSTYLGNRFDVITSCASNSGCYAGYSCVNLRCQGNPKNNFCREEVTNPVQSTCKYCSIISQNWQEIEDTNETTVATSDCNTVDHVNMNIFSSVKMNFPSRVSNSYTIGFWLYVSNISAMGDNTVNFIFENHSMLSVGYLEGTGLKTYLNPLTRYTPNYTGVTSTAFLEGLISQNNPISLNTVVYANPNDKWIYIRYATTYEGLVYSLISHSNQRNIVESTTSNGYDVDGSTITYPFKYFFGDTMTYSINNLGSLFGNTSFFVKSLALLGDFLPANSLFHYYDLNTVDYNLFPSLYFFFDPIYQATSKTLTFKYTTYYSGETTNTSTISTTSSDDGVFSFSHSGNDWAIPFQFYRLTLAPFNQYFTNGDLLTSETTSFTGCSNQMCGSYNYPVSCPSPQIMDISAGVCNNSCPNNFITNHGQYLFDTQDSQYCSYPSNDENTALSDINGALYSSNKISTLNCNTLNQFWYQNYFQSFERCIQNTYTDDGALHYSGFFGTPETIKLNIQTTSIDNYYVDFFMYVDQAYATGESYTLWLTESVAFTCSNYNTCYISIGSTSPLIYYEDNNNNFIFTYLMGSNWFHITYNVNYNPTSGMSTLTFYNNRATLNGDEYLTSTVTGKTEFKSINFMHDQSFFGNTINWGSAYYRNIKVWNNDDGSMPYNVFNQLDRYWNLLKHSVARFDNLIVFFPLNLQKISSKTIQDQDFTDTSISANYNYLSASYTYDQLQNSASITTEVFQRWNYQRGFDRFEGTATTSFTSTESYFNTPVQTPCDTGCLKCTAIFDSNSLEYAWGYNCLVCDDTEQYYLENGVCLQNSKAYYYFISPSYVNENSNNQNFVQDSRFDFDYSPDSTAFSVSFFVKLLGWSTTPYLTQPTSGTSATYFDLFRFGRLVLRYYFADNNLCLEDNVESPLITTKTLCYNQNTNTFLSRLGLWTHISLSYYYNPANNSYYPTMFNLQINHVNILPSSGNIASSLGFQASEMFRLTIPKEVIAVWAKIRAIDKYINGAYSEVTNQEGLFLSDFSKLFETVNSNTNGNNCWDNSIAFDALQAKSGDLVSYTLHTQCVLDYDPIIDTTLYCSDYSFLSYDNASAACKTPVDSCRYGFYLDYTNSVNYCSCTSDHSIRDQYIVKDSTASDRNNKCVTHDYIDFGQYDTLSMTVKQPTREYTLEFWVHVNRYETNSNDDVFSLRWQNQLKIDIYYSTSNYAASCYPIYVDESDTSFSYSMSQDLSMDKWAYVKCSVSRTVWAAFLTTNDIAGSDKEEVNISSLSTNPDMPIVFPDNDNYPSSTTFTFKNLHLNNGVIYFRQLRLWSCYKCQSPALHKLVLNSTTAKYYDALSHLWDPVYDHSSKYSTYVTKDLRSAPEETTYDMNNSNYSSDWIGYNVLDENNYSVLDTTNQLCASTTGCLQNNECPPGCATCDSFECLSCTIGYALWSDGSCINKGFNKSIDLFVYSGAYTDNTMTTRMNLQLAPASYVVSGESGSMIYQMTTNFFVKFDSSTFDSDNNILFIYGNDLQIKYYKEEDVLILANSDNSSVFAEFYNYKALGLKWHSITISYYFNEAQNDYYPAMLNFQVNNMHVNINKINLSGLIDINSIVIPSTVDGLFAKITTIPHYIIGGLEEIDYQRINPNRETFRDNYDGRTFFLDTYFLDNNSCLSKSNLISDYTGYPTCAHINQFEYDNIDEYTWCVNYSSLTITDLASANKYDSYGCANTNFNLVESFCHYGFYNNQYNDMTSCSCPSSNSITNNFIQYDNSDSDYYATFTCKKPTYVDFGQTDNFEVTPSNLSSAGGSKEWTLEFWSYVNTYVPAIFTDGYQFLWNNKLAITVYYDTTKKSYASVCQPLYESTDSSWNGVTDNITIPSSHGRLNRWFYLRCSVSLNSGTYKHYQNTMLESSSGVTEHALGSTYRNFNPTSSDSFKFINNSLNKGAINFRQIRLWGCYDCISSNVYSQVLNSIEISNLVALLNLWDPLFTDDINNYPSSVADPKNDVSFTPVISANWLGYNQLEASQVLIISDVNDILNVQSCAANCSGCTSSSSYSCTGCNIGYVLYFNTCQLVTGNYAKFPRWGDVYMNTDTALHLRTSDETGYFSLSSQNVFSFTIWIKYFSQYPYIESKRCSKIFNFSSDNRFSICYNPNDNSLNFVDGEQVMFADSTVFSSLIGQWTLISFSNVSGLNNYYQPLYRFYIQNQEIVKNSEYIYGENNITFDRFDVVYQFNGLLSDLKVYNDFLVNPYGYILSNQVIINLAYTVTFNSYENTNILSLLDDDVDLNQYPNYIQGGNQTLSETLGAYSEDDYHPYASQSCPNKNYFDVSLLLVPNSKTNCVSNALCSYGCSDSNSSSSCSCETESTEFWLKQDSETKKLSCESVLYTDFSRGAVIIDKISVSPTQEFSTEFWFYVNYYGTDKTNNHFESHDVIWDKHNYVNIYKNDNNGVSVKCSPVYDSKSGYDYKGTADSTLVDNDNYSIITPTDPTSSKGDFKKWVYVQCSSSIPRRIYNLNNRHVKNISYKDFTIPDITRVSTTTLSISGNGPVNYGFLFIRQLKLWTQYNIRKFTTECVQTEKTLVYYEFLNHLFDNKLNGYQIVDFLDPLVSSTIEKDSNFMGFNVIDQTPISYDPLVTCSQMVLFPTTGFTYNIFNLQAKEINQNSKNTYLFFYVIKDFEEEVVINPTVNNRDYQFKFNITESLFGTQVGSDNNTLIIDVYCNITYADVDQISITLYQQLTLRKVTSLYDTTNFGNITSTMNIQPDTTDLEILFKSNALANLNSDLFNSTVISIVPLSQVNNTSLTGTLNTVISSNPTCESSPNFCNSRGVCYVVDVNLYCQCNAGYVGTNCQMTSANYQSWLDAQALLVNEFSNRISNANGIVDTNIIQSVNNLFNTTANLANSLNQTTAYQNIMSAISSNANNPANAQAFATNIQSLVGFAYQMYQLGIKSANNDRYNNVLTALQNNQTVNANITVQYYNTTSNNTQISGRLLSQLNYNLSSNSDVTWIIQLDNAAEVPLTADQQKIYQTNNDQITLYLNNIANGIFKSSNTEVEHTYKSDAFNVVMKKIFGANISTFNFVNYFTVHLNRVSTRNSYFDAQSCLNEFISSNINNLLYDFTNIGLVYVEKQIPDQHYNLNLMADSVSTTHTITFFDNKGKQMPVTCTSGVTHYLPINVINNQFGFVQDLSYGNLKYTALIVELSKYYAGNYFPYFIFPNGTIDHSDIALQKQWYYKNYNVSVEYFDSTLNDYSNTGVEFLSIDDNLYIVANSKHLSEFNSFAQYAPVNTPAKNWYFMDFNSLHTCMPNIRGNMCFYVVILLFAIHIIYLLIAILIATIKSRRKNPVENFKADLQDEITMSQHDNDNFKDIRVFSVDSSNAKSKSPVNIEFQVIENKEVPPGVENAKIKEENVQIQIQKGVETENVLVANAVQTQGGLVSSNNGKTYNLFHFILFRNIYVNTFASSSPFAPKYKSISKLAFFVYLLFLIVLLCCVYYEQNLSVYSIQNQGQLAGLLFIAVFCANAVLILLGLITKTSNTHRNTVISAHIAERDLTNLISITVRSNVLKTILLNILSIGIAGVLYYFAVGFCATWIQWAHNLLILWLLAVLIDFLIAEICFELLIYVLYICRNRSSILRSIFNFVLSLKNLRNNA